MNKIAKINFLRRDNGDINWINSVGKDLDFTYNDYHGRIRIISVNNSMVKYSIGDNTFENSTTYLREANLESVMMKLNYLDTSNIKKTSYGSYNWIGSVGEEIPFMYNGYIGEFKIINSYQVNTDIQITLQYKNNNVKVPADRIMNKDIDYIAVFFTKEFDNTKDNTTTITKDNTTTDTKDRALDEFLSILTDKVAINNDLTGFKERLLNNISEENKPKFKEEVINYIITNNQKEIIRILFKYSDIKVKKQAITWLTKRIEFEELKDMIYNLLNLDDISKVLIDMLLLRK